MTRWIYLMIAVTILAWLATGYVYFARFDDLPEQIPTHWGIDGKPDHWVPRENAWMNFYLVPAMMTGWIGLTLVLPWLSPRPFSVDRFKGTYGYVMAIVGLLFGYIHALLLWGSMDSERRFERALMAGIFLIIALMGNVMGKVKRNLWMGVRTPWTIASELVWNKTHRFAAWLYFASGIVCALMALVAPMNAVVFAILVIGFIVAALVPVPYSFILYKRLEREGKLDVPAEEAPAI